jgi:hypothetical protein
MLTKEYLITLGFKEIPHFTIMNNLIYDLGRNRHLSIGSLGTCNEVMFICESNPDNYKEIIDLICLHNYDFNGFLTKEKLESLLSFFKK